MFLELFEQFLTLIEGRFFGIVRNQIIPHTQRIFLEILLIQTKIRLYVPFSDWFGTADGYYPFFVPNQSENGQYSLISVWSNNISERILCVQTTVIGRPLFRPMYPGDIMGYGMSLIRVFFLCAWLNIKT